MIDNVIFWERLTGTVSDLLWMLFLILLLRIYRARFIYLWLLASVVFLIQGGIEQLGLRPVNVYSGTSPPDWLFTLSSAMWFAGIAINILATGMGIRHLTWAKARRIEVKDE